MTTRRRSRFAGPAMLFALITVAASATPSPRGVYGRWLMDFDRDGSIQLTLKRRDTGHNSWNSSDDYRRSDFQGLTVPTGAADVPTKFTLPRDAGTISFEGVVNDAGGSGRFTFEPNPDYLAALSRLGYAKPDEDD